MARQTLMMRDAYIGEWGNPNHRGHHQQRVGEKATQKSGGLNSAIPAYDAMTALIWLIPAIN